MPNPSHRPATLLLVEDNPADVRLVREALGAGPGAPVLHVVGDGEDALRFLRRQPPFADAPRPELVLLDLNLPRRDGREVLAEAKADPALRTIPVVVFTTSQFREDVGEAYRLGANAYVSKPVGLQPFLEAMRTIESYWLQVVHLPADDPSTDPDGSGSPGD
jgi:chemotaxis family two-component system response regulator Rcp1